MVRVDAGGLRITRLGIDAPPGFHKRRNAMLCLSRKVGQKIVIEDEAVVITVISIGRGRVQLHIHAPGASIDREEVYLAKKKQKEALRAAS